MSDSFKDVTVDPVVNPLNLRWLIRRDLDEVIRIENESYSNPWTEEEFIVCLRQRNHIGTTLLKDGEVIGYCIYELFKARLKIINMAITPSHRRQGNGRYIMARMFNKLSQQRRSEIIVEVRETNLEAQLFFSSVGFRATQILRNQYVNCREDAYLMSYNLFSGEEF